MTSIYNKRVVLKQPVKALTWESNLFRCHFD